MTTPLTGTTLTNQRAANRWKKYECIVSAPPTIFTARINQTFSSLENVISITYDGGTGTYSDVPVGAACWIGSAAGLSDIGIVRVRAALTATAAPIGSTTGLALADNLYLTFVQDFPLAQRVPVKTDTLELMDSAVEFSDPVANAPIVRIGPAAYYLRLTGATVSMTWPAPDIYSPTGATVTGYVWTAPGSSSSSGMTGATPTMTWNAAGEYYISLTVTDSAFGTSYVTRKIFVKTAASAVILEGSDVEVIGDVDGADWYINIRGLRGVELSSIKDRAMVVLAKTDYASTAAATSYGPYTNAAHIRLIGWIDGDSLSINPDFGTASFTVHGPAYWLDKIPGAPMLIQDGTSAAWNNINVLDIDKALHRLITWGCNLSQICDVTLTGTTARQYTININSGSVMEQIRSIANEKTLARSVFDPFGGLFITIPPSLRTSAQKAANTILWDIAQSDITEISSMVRNPTARSAQVEISGTTYDGSTEAAIYSRAPGVSAGASGSPDAPTSTLAFADQADANRQSGQILAAANITYESIELSLPWANDYAGWAMANGYLVRLSVTSGKTPRGISFTDKRFEILSVAYEFDSATGAESTILELAEETTGVDGVTYVPPTAGDTTDWELPGLPGVGLPGIGIWYPPVIMPPPGDVCGEPNAVGAFFSPSVLTGTDTITSSYFYYPCRIRDDGSTVISCRLKVEGDAGSNLSCYAVDAGKGRVLSGVMTEATGDYGPLESNWTLAFTAPAGGVDVAGFEIFLEPGGEEPSSSGVVTMTPVGVTTTPVVNTGSVTVNSATMTSVAANMVRTDVNVTFVDESDLLENSLEIFSDFTQSGPATIATTVYFIPSNNWPQWRLNGNIDRNKLLYYYTPATLSGGTHALVFSSADGTGLMNVIIRIYYASGPMTSNVRRMSYLGGMLYNVCAVGATLP